MLAAVKLTINPSVTCSGNLFCLVDFCGLVRQKCVCVSVCTYRCSAMAYSLTHTVLLAVWVSANIGGSCDCGTCCANTCWAAFGCSSPGPDVFWITDWLCLVGFLLGGGAVEAKPWTRPSPSYTARNLLRQGEVSDLPHCSFFPRHSCGQLRAVDIHLLCFMIETQSNSTYTCS